MNPRQENALTYAMQQIRQSDIKEDIDKIILYGSVAKGKSRFQSDIDLLFIMKKIDKYNKRPIIFLKGSLTHPDISLPEIDAKFITQETWKKEHSLYLNNVRKDGICIYGNE